MESVSLPLITFVHQSFDTVTPKGSAHPFAILTTSKSELHRWHTLEKCLLSCPDGVHDLSSLEKLTICQVQLQCVWIMLSSWQSSSKEENYQSILEVSGEKGFLASKMSKHLVLNTDICLPLAYGSQCLPTGREYLCLYQPSSPITPTSLPSRTGNFRHYHISTMPAPRSWGGQTTTSAPWISPPSKCLSGSPPLQKSQQCHHPVPDPIVSAPLLLFSLPS